MDWGAAGGYSLVRAVVRTQGWELALSLGGGGVGEDEPMISVLCVKYSPENHLLKHRAPSLTVKDVSSRG